MECLALTDTRAADPAIAGPKAAALSALARAGLPVPPAIIVPATIYRRFLAESGIDPAAVAGDPEDAAAAAEAAARVAALFAQTPFPPAMAQVLRAALRASGLDHDCAVRSTATTEDLAGAAFAGAHDSYLDCGDLDSILGRIRDCWASLWNARALLYRRRMGIAHADAAMAVLVQRMVRAEIAGVLFTANPVNGRCDEMLAEFAAGLGEAVVSGEVAVSQCRLLRDGTGIRAALGNVALAPLQREGLRALGLAVEHARGAPQDIEWAWADGRAWLLQARPVTRMAIRWTRSESGERFPRAMSPLGWAFIDRGFHEALDHSFALMGWPRADAPWFACHDHYVYGNETLIARYAARIAPSLPDWAAVASLRDRWQADYGWLDRLPRTWYGNLPDYLALVANANEVDVAVLDDAALWAHVVALRAAGNRYFRPNIAISLGQRLLYTVLARLLVRALGEGGEQHLAAMVRVERTETARVNAALSELAALLVKEPALLARFHADGARAVCEEGLTPGDFAQAFSGFLREHGHRETDIDPVAPTWGEVPWVVIDQLRAIASVDVDRAPASTAVAGVFISRVPRELRGFVDRIIRLACEYTALDDAEHYHTTRLTPPMRRALLALGDRLCRQGIACHADDVFFAQPEELEAHFTGARRLSASTLAARRDAWQRSAATEPPFVHGERDEPPSEGALAGLPGSPGTVEGNVYVVRSEQDFAGFPPGAVLVARTTNPSWTPLFFAARAVLTENGGPLSHGAVTARELGIPAVMGVPALLRQLRNGDRVRVDGARGTIERVA